MDNLNPDMCGDWFSSIDDLLNFPCEDFEGDVGFEEGLRDVWQTPKETLSHFGAAACDSSFSTEGSGISSSLPTELPVPCDDIAQLEWLSNFVEDSFSAGNITPDEDSSINKNSNNNKESNEPYRFQTSSPISVLSNNSCSEVKTMPVKPEIIVPGRARSKRPRPATFIPRPIIPLIPTTSLVTNSIPQFPSAELVSKLEKSAESRITLKLPKPVAAEAKKRKKAKISPLPGATEQFGSQQVRKCLHCEITKTPQWRAGPLGPKTLCNACGVRYKSGRLFPEYRPAASPTFVSTLHSNSHKKVLEMRTKGENSAEILSSGSNMLIEYGGREDLLF